MADQYEPPPPSGWQSPGPPGDQPYPPTGYPPAGYPSPDYPPTDYPPTEIQPGQYVPPPAYGAPPQPYQPYQYGDPSQNPWGYAPIPPPPGGVQPKSPGRRGLILGLAVAGVIVLVVAAVNASRRNKDATTGSTALPSFSFSFSLPTPSPDSSEGSGGGLFGQDPNGSLIPSVFCPVVRDEKSHLAYRCIDDKMTQGPSDNYLGLRISLDSEVEPGWVISEGSGNPDSIVASPSDPTDVALVVPAAPTPGPTSAQDIQKVVQDRLKRALRMAYGDNPSSKVLSEGARKIDGVDGWELNVEITMNPKYRSERVPPLKTNKERLWIVGVPTKAGVSIFMLSIPDLRKELWPKAEDTIDTIKII